MSIKRVRSASRVLAVLEAVAEHQPIGVGALARLLDDRGYAQRLAARGQAHVRERLTTGHFAARLAEVLHDVAAR
jgi:hypothetical protein